MNAHAHAADGEEFSFEYHHYEEGKRNLYDQTYRDLNLKPIQVDSLGISSTGEITDRVKFGFTYTQDTWSGATPVATVPLAAVANELFTGASTPTSYYADSKHDPVTVNWDTFDGNTAQFSKDSRLVHVMGSASPETRRQAEVKLGYEADDADVNIGGGISEEPDYHTRFLNMGGGFDFDEKRTTASWGWSYTAADIDASLAADTAADWGYYLNHIRYRNGIVPTLYEKRHDWSANLGVTQILNKNALLEGSLGYTTSVGYLSNPYKAVVLAFDDPDQFLGPGDFRTVVLKGTLEQRPTLRNQWTWTMRYVQYIDNFDAALHINYRFFRDNWGIDAHTLDAAWYQPLGDGWMITPSARYYTQTKADFYQPYFLFNEAFPILLPRNPELPPNLDHSKIPLHFFSSDERLSAFGEVSGQIEISKQISDNMRFELGAEYSKHAGALKLGGGGEGSYADFHSYTFYAALNIDPAARADSALNNYNGDNTSISAASSGNKAAPAGVFFDHMLSAGDFAVDYRHQYGIRNGGMRHGSRAADDQAVLNGCDDVQCQFTESNLYSHIQTIDFLYAPADWLTLEITPQLVDRHIDLRQISYGFLRPAPIGIIQIPTESAKHTVGSFGDTGVTALIRLFDDGENHVHAGLGLSLPTGSVGKRLSGSQEFVNYGMQPGSGTWDLHPSITYLGQSDRFSWGAQLSGIARIDGRNSSGYRMGDIFQATGWISYDIFHWLSASLRDVYTAEGAVKGQFKSHPVPSIVDFKYEGTLLTPVYAFNYQPNSVFDPTELPSNYGGHYRDIGFGLSAEIPEGQFAGNRFNLEWLQPVKDNFNGYQLRRTGTLSFTWNIAM